MSCVHMRRQTLDIQWQYVEKYACHITEYPVQSYNEPAMRVLFVHIACMISIT